MEIIKEIILKRTDHSDDFYFDRVVQALKTLCGNNAIEFGVIPMLRINNKLVFNEETCPYSILVERASNARCARRRVFKGRRKIC